MFNREPDERTLWMRTTRVIIVAVALGALLLAVATMSGVWDSQVNRVIAAAELLLVFIIALEGLLALAEISDTGRRARFDTEVRIYDFSRELHTIAFGHPRLWKVMRPSDAHWNEEGELETRFVQLFFNMTYLQWKATKLGYLPESLWLRDFHLSLTRQYLQFWKEHAGAYDPQFAKWVDGVILDFPR